MNFSKEKIKTIESDHSQGHDLYLALSQLNLKSLNIRKESLEKLKNIDSVIIIGSSWSGKTTIRDILDANKISPFSFPKRIITREQRPNDNLIENDFVQDLDSLKSRVRNGYIWKRDLGEKVEYYGFEEPEKESLPIYSANNAMIRERDSLIQEPKPQSIRGALILLIYAPDNERVERNAKREGSYLDDKPRQKQIRASDRAISMYQDCHILVKNSNTQDKEEQTNDLKALLGAIAKIKKSPKYL